MDLIFFVLCQYLDWLFALPVVVLPIVSAYNPDIHKRSVVSSVAMIMTFLSVLIPSIFGYLMFGAETKDSVLLNFDDNDALAICLRIAFYVIVSVSYPCISQTMMNSWSQRIFGISKHQDLPNSRRAIVIILNNAIPILIAMFLPNAGPALSIGGAMGGYLCDFFFPGLLWVVNSKNRWYTWRNILCILLAIFGFVSAAISTYLAILDAVALMTN